jgi:murein DD-endopeptidase MepM/ murein hydrolase activator NlpD
MRPDAGAVLLPQASEPDESLPPPDRAVDVQASEGLAAPLLKAGVGGLDAALAEQAGGDLSGRADLWLGSRVGANARELDRLELRAGGGRRIVLERQGDVFVRRDLVEQVDVTPVRIRLGAAEAASGLVEAGLQRETRDRILDRMVGLRLAAIDLIVAHEAGKYGARYGEPLYLGLHLADGSIRRWVGEGAQLRSLGSDEAAPSGLLRPLPGPVTSNPGLRFHPILRYLRWHRGTDFASPAGTPVQAASEGRVIDAGWQGGYGRTVRIAHRDGSTTLYAHLSQIDVADGQPVARGAVIGKVGSTGLATGPHLHFEWQLDGATLQPAFGAGQVAGGPAHQAALRALLSAPFRLPPERGS